MGFSYDRGADRSPGYGRVGLRPVPERAVPAQDRPHRHRSFTEVRSIMWTVDASLIFPLRRHPVSRLPDLAERPLPRLTSVRADGTLEMPAS